MEIIGDIFKLAAGMGLFLFAMYLLEESLKNLSGRNFKLFLQRVTKNKTGAVAGGAIVTAVLQSSSMVSLMVLAFVEAGVFTMKNAMAVILGANLGTTIDSWLVATLGFKVNIEIVAYPAIFAGGLLLILLGRRRSVKYLSFFLVGFGLLFIGLSFMKTAMEARAMVFDFSSYAGVHLAVFLCIGFVLTVLVQSSSVTMALTLSALYAGAIGFAPAAAIVLGSETGTTIKILLGTVGGTAAKKRVALGNVFFNVFLTVIVFVLLPQILYLISSVFNISNPLIGLVTFSSLSNLLSIVIFLPFLNPFARFLELFYKDTDTSATAFIGHVNSEEPETALYLFRKETAWFIHNSMIFNLGLFDIDTKPMDEHSEYKSIGADKKLASKTTAEKYEFLKQLQGELQAFYLKLRSKLQGEQGAELNQLISAVRSSMHSVKSMKDILNNIDNLNRSSKDIKFNLFMYHKKETEDLYRQLNAMVTQHETEFFKKLLDIYNTIQSNYTSTLSNFYEDAQDATLEDMDITIAINFNRELFTSNKAMVMAVKDFLLKEKEAKIFNEIPVYKT